jgi:hypothetical protein
MATDNVTPIRACADGTRTLPYYGYLTAPLDQVRVTIERFGDDKLCIEYRGLPEVLIAGALATEAQLQPGPRGIRRFDADGDKLTLRRGRGRARTAIVRYKPLANAATMPGVEAWMIEAVKAEQAEHAAAYNAHMAKPAQEELAPDLWRARRLGMISGLTSALRDLCGLADRYARLEDGWRVNAEDAAAFTACVVRAERELTAIMQRMRIERTVTKPTRGLRLVVCNNGSEVRP